MGGRNQRLARFEILLTFYDDMNLGTTMELSHFGRKFIPWKIGRELGVSLSDSLRTIGILILKNPSVC